MTIEDKARQFQDQATAAVDKIGDKVDAKVQSNAKYIKYAAIAIAVVGVILLLVRGF